MSEEEIEKLSTEYADGLKKWFPDMEEHTYRDKKAQAKNVIWLIMRDYCIVPKVEILNQHAWYMQRMKEVSSTRQMNRGKAIALENLFGRDMFEQKGERQ